MIYRILASTAIVLIVSFSFVVNVLAHGGEPRLEISVERTNPGGAVDVRGVEFESEELITLALTGDGFEFPLGEIVADTEGIFLQTVTIPADLAEGAYSFRAVTDDHEIISPALTVIGAAISEDGGGQGLRDEDDGLLAPMPTFAPGVIPGGASQPATQQTPASTRNPTLFVVLILLVAGILVLFGMRFAGKRDVGSK